MSNPLDLTLFELKLFVRTSRVRSLRELAREMELRPAHVSKLIRRIEDKLDIRLFNRSASGIALLPEALNFLRTAEEILELSDGLTPSKAGAARSTATQSALGIGAVSFIQTCLVVPAVPLLTRTRPQLRLRLVETPREELVSQGLNGAFEAAVHIGPLEWTRSWTSKKAGSLKFGLYATASHELGRDVEEKEVLLHPFVIPTYWVNQRLAAGIDLCPVSVKQRLWGHETTTATSALQMLRVSKQLSFLPRLVAADAVKRGEVKEIRVRSWPEIEKDVFVSVRSDLVSQVLYRDLLKSLATITA